MSKFDESTYSVAVEPTTGDYPAFDSNNNPIPYTADFSLSATDELCFKCPLSDCKENSVKCLINIAAAKK